MIKSAVKFIANKTLLLRLNKKLENAKSKAQLDKIKQKTEEGLTAEESKIRLTSMSKFKKGSLKKQYEKRDEFLELLDLIEEKKKIIDIEQTGFEKFMSISKNAINFARNPISVIKDIFKEDTSKMSIEDIAKKNNIDTRLSKKKNEEESKKKNEEEFKKKNEEPLVEENPKIENVSSKISINPDTLTEDKITDINEKIYKLLEDINQPDAAEYFLDIITRPDVKNISDIKTPKDIEKLTSVNKEILMVLKDIEEKLVDEQDTSIKKTEKNVEKNIESKIIKEEPKKDEESWLSKLFSSLFGAGIFNLLKFAKNPLGLVTSLFSLGKGTLLPLVSNIVTKAISPIKGLLDIVMKMISKIPGVSNLLDKTSKLKTNIQKTVDNTKSKILDVKDKTANNISNTKDTIKNSLSKENVKSIAKEGLKKSSSLLKGGLKAASGALRVMGPIGLVIGIALSADDAVAGYKNASSNLGIEEKNLTTGNKIASGAGGFISSMTLGIADAKSTGQGLNNVTGGNSVIEKYEAEGIIDYDWIGDSEVKDWKKLENLSGTEIIKIHDIDDWDKTDQDKMRKILIRKKTEEQFPFELWKRVEEWEIPENKRFYNQANVSEMSNEAKRWYWENSYQDYAEKVINKENKKQKYNIIIDKELEDHIKEEISKMPENKRIVNGVRVSDMSEEEKNQYWSQDLVDKKEIEANFEEKPKENKVNKTLDTNKDKRIMKNESMRNNIIKNGNQKQVVVVNQNNKGSNTIINNNKNEDYALLEAFEL